MLFIDAQSRFQNLGAPCTVRLVAFPETLCRNVHETLVDRRTGSKRIPVGLPNLNGRAGVVRKQADNWLPGSAVGTTMDRYERIEFGQAR